MLALNVLYEQYWMLQNDGSLDSFSVNNFKGHKKGNAIFVFCLCGVKTTLNSRSAADCYG